MRLRSKLLYTFLVVMVLPVLLHFLMMAPSQFDRKDLAEALIIFFIMAYCFMMVLIFVQDIIGPLQKLKEGTEKVTEGDLDVRIDVKSKDEIGDVAATFNRMTTYLQTALISRDKLEEKNNLLEALRRASFNMMQDAEMARQELEVANRKLKKSNEELEQFAYVASHDLQDPLRKIQAFGDILVEDHASELSEKARENVASIQRSARRMSELINDLLEYSRVGRSRNEFVNVCLNDTVKDVLFDLAERVSRMGAKVEAGELPVIMADSVQMRQLFQNLIGNALTYVGRGVVPHVKIRAECQDGLARIHVSDNGIGISSEYFTRIFQPFRRLHKKDDYEGTGIGLAICEKISERHGGRILVDSVLGQGSTFTVVLPLAGTEQGVS